MKLCHSADWHIGLKTHGRVGERGINTAVWSGIDCLRSAVDAAIEHQVDVFIGAGDMMHDHSPDAVALVLVKAELDRLSAAGIPAVLVPGNHDRGASAGQSSILEVFRGPLVHVHSMPAAYIVGDLKIGTFPSVSRHQAHAARPDWRADTDRLVMDVVTSVLDGYRSFPGGIPDVVVGHWPVQGSVLGPEADISLISEPVIPVGALEGPWYAALGHLHVRQQIDHAGVWGGYSGSIDRVSFSEASDEKSIRIVDLDSRDSYAVPLPARSLVEFDLDGDLDLLPEDPPVEGAIVKVKARLKPGTDVEAFKRGARQLLVGADSVIFEIHRERAERPVVESIVKAPGPIEAVDEWARAQELGDIEREALGGYVRDLIGRPA